MLTRGGPNNRSIKGVCGSTQTAATTKQGNIPRCLPSNVTTLTVKRTSAAAVCNKHGTSNLRKHRFLLPAASGQASAKLSLGCNPKNIKFRSTGCTENVGMYIINCHPKKRKSTVPKSSSNSAKLNAKSPKKVKQLAERTARKVPDFVGRHKLVESKLEVFKLPQV